MAEDWRKQSERSTPFMLRVIVFLAQHVSRTVVRVILYPTVAYFLVSSPRSLAASAGYLRRALGRAPNLRDHWRHFFAFASCTLDRVFLLGKNFSAIRVEASRSAAILPLVASGRGCLLVVAHYGSTEVLRFTPAAGQERGEGVVTARGSHIKTTILLDRQHGRMLMQLLEQLDPEMALDILDAAERGPQLVLKLKEALEAGRMVCVMADRVAENESYAVVDFLGGRARFATTPWLLAATLKVPVILGFGTYLGGNRYRNTFELFEESVVLPRSNRDAALAELAQRYAARLEHYLRQAPYNWFNFYDYWSNEALSSQSDATTAD